MKETTKPVAKTGLVAPFVVMLVAVLVGAEDVGIDMLDKDSHGHAKWPTLQIRFEGEPVDAPPMGASQYG